MGKLLAYFRRRLVFKIGVVTLVVILLGFAAYMLRTSHKAAAAVEGETRDSSQRLARGIIAGIRSSMLAGSGIVVQGLIEDAQSQIPTVSIRVFDASGAPVFAQRPPAPAPESLAEPLRRALAAEPAMDGEVSFRPIPNEERCMDCHPDGTMRGVLALRAVGKSAQRGEVVAQLVHQAFLQIMTARKTKVLDSYFGELREHAGLIGVVVFDHEGSPSFGERPPGDEAQWKSALDAALVPGAKPSTFQLTNPPAEVHLVPLPWEKRCQECHKKPDPVRGVLAVALAPGRAPGPELEDVVTVSVQNMMLAALGRLIAHYLDDTAKTGAVSELRLYDSAGRLYHDAFAHPTPPPGVAEALRTQRANLHNDGAGSLIVVEPLLNDERCQRCHDDDLPVRGAVEIRASLGRARKARRSIERDAQVYALGTVIAVFLLLWFVLKWIVVDPVRRIGDVAERIGSGDLGAKVPGRAQGGDEVARLGQRINQMLTGLRTKLHLEKFVSRGAAQAAADAGQAGQSLDREGMRRTCTVLFTDIRGFTAFSERIPPERVVSMLNRILAAQARVVYQHGGDIDKFVGDELMAVFWGADGPARAVRCALEMVDAVNAARAGEETIAVGAGIAHGDVVYGAIGAEQRVDYTVIGDVVNTGARLCSAASPGDVLTTTAVRDKCDNEAGFAFEPIEPLKLKGKSQPLATYRARRA